MSNVNRRIIETIDSSSHPQEIKNMLKTMLNIELRNSQSKSSLYGRDYDRIILETVDERRKMERK